jgi:hypothetical protein
MKTRPALIFAAILAFHAVAPRAFAQNPKQETKEPAEQGRPLDAPGGQVEIGFRTYWGDVYGRSDLPFRPNLATSKLNEYGNIRRNFYIRRANVTVDDIPGTKNFIKYQTQSAFYRNQSHLVTFGQYGKFKLQGRYDEIPHVYTNTARTLYTESGPGVYTMPLNIRQTLQTASSTGTAAQINSALPSFIATQVIPGLPVYTPEIERKTASGLFNYDLKPEWTVAAFYAREHETGTRPIGTILNSSPSAGGSSQPGTTANRQSPGVGVELPEPINYFNNTVKAATEIGKKKWVLQLGYTGSFFRSDVKSLLFDSPFATADLPVQIIPPGNGCTPVAPALNCTIGATPSRGQLSLYPDNSANYLNVAGAFGNPKQVRVMGTASNGWLRQNEPFLPYTANTAITGLGQLPSSSLHGDKKTLAMNWTAVSNLRKNTQLEAKYRQYAAIRASIARPSS